MNDHEIGAAHNEYLNHKALPTYRPNIVHNPAAGAKPARVEKIENVRKAGNAGRGEERGREERR